MNSDWLTLLGFIFGTGGFGIALVNAFANREKTAAEAKKIEADVIASLSEAYETRIERLIGTTERLERKVLALENQVCDFKVELGEREAIIDKLKRENEELTEQVGKLTKAIGSRDKRIRELEKQVAELTERLNLLNGNC